jgi:hypothetical protein
VESKMMMLIVVIMMGHECTLEGNQWKGRRKGQIMKGEENQSMLHIHTYVCYIYYICINNVMKHIKQCLEKGRGSKEWVWEYNGG